MSDKNLINDVQGYETSKYPLSECPKCKGEMEEIDNNHYRLGEDGGNIILSCVKCSKVYKQEYGITMTYFKAEEEKECSKCGSKGVNEDMPFNPDCLECQNMLKKRDGEK